MLGVESSISKADTQPVLNVKKIKEAVTQME